MKKNNDIVYSTDNWDITADLENISSCWNKMNAQFIVISGVKYSILHCEIDSLVATSVRGKGHIVGAKDEDRKIIAYLKPEGDKKAAIVEVSKVLEAIHSNKPYIPANVLFNTATPANVGANIRTPLDPHLIRDVEEFLNWIEIPDGLQDYISYYLRQHNASIISELSKIYMELKKICRL
ncbi:MAG: hypothetical protein ACFFAN_07710 [Promethearchaeota archaeon]